MPQCPDEVFAKQQNNSSTWKRVVGHLEAEFLVAHGVGGATDRPRPGRGVRFASAAGQGIVAVVGIDIDQRPQPVEDRRTPVSVASLQCPSTIVVVVTIGHCRVLPYPAPASCFPPTEFR